jgi:methylated-DNA-[protein]-cysteine S-methyltransferase
MSAMQFRTIDSPVGPLTLAGNGRRLTHLWMIDQTHEPSHGAWERNDKAFSDAVEQLDAYFAGERREFDLELDLVGTNFQRRVWEALLTIPYGETRSYGYIAEQIGSPGAFRAVGLANGRNPIGIIVPCHRVIGANGSSPGTAVGWSEKRFCWNSKEAGVSPDTAMSARRRCVSGSGQPLVAASAGPRVPPSTRVTALPLASC